MTPTPSYASLLQGPMAGAPAAPQSPVDRGELLLRKLLARITFGPRPAELVQAQQLGYHGFLEMQLAPASIDDSALDAQLAASYPEVFLTSAQLWAYSGEAVIPMLQDATILRALKSKRQLYERVVQFWNDHFNIYAGKPSVWNLLLPFHQGIIRQHALGKFSDLLGAVAQGPAMLHYLDNQLSIAGAPNQNYARELMELHTLGVDNGYTQADVIAAARCLTGWGYKSFGSVAGAGTYQFSGALHDNGAKNVLGVSIPAGGGIQDGLTVVAALANHPNTAHFLAGKLCRWFLGEEVPESLVASVASVYLATGTDLKQVVRAILQPQNVLAAKPKLRRPFHSFVASMRAIPTTLNGPGGHHRRARFASAGDLPFDFVTPNGPPDTFQQWSDLMLPRWNFNTELTDGVIWDTVVDLNSFFAGKTTAQQVMDHIDSELFLGAMPSAQKQALASFLNVNPSNSTRRKETLALALSSPAFQWM